MWPFKKTADREYLRIGRCALERWTGSQGHLRMTARRPLSARATVLAPALSEIFSSPVATKVSAIVESAIMPLVLLETHSRMWRQDELTAVARHRLDMEDSSTPGNLVRTDYMPGDSHALAYVLELEFRQSLLEAGEAAGVQWASVEPAFGWSLARYRADRKTARRPGWWVWPEHDRVLVARLVKGRTVYLNAGAVLGNTADPVARLVAQEHARAGIETAQPTDLEPMTLGVWR